MPPSLPYSGFLDCLAPGPAEPCGGRFAHLLCFLVTFTTMCYVTSKWKNTAEAVFLKIFHLKTPDTKIQAEMTALSVRTCPSKFT